MIKTSRRVAELWCKMMHRAPMWPSHGHYRCRTCGRRYPVPWERDHPVGDATAQRVQAAILGDRKLSRLLSLGAAVWRSGHGFPRT